jgi:hypothetical protein
MKIKEWWATYKAQKLRESKCSHENAFSYCLDNGLCREHLRYCPDCERGFKPEGVMVRPGEWWCGALLKEIEEEKKRAEKEQRWLASQC